MVDDPLEELLDYQEGEEVDLDKEKSDVEDTDDGGAIVTIEEEGTEYDENKGFYINLAESIPKNSSKELATDLLDAIARDK